MSLGIRIDGLPELVRRLRPELVAEPLRTFLARATANIEAASREGSPSDAGRYRAAWASRVDAGLIPQWGQVSNPVKYARAIEHGTGRLSDAPGGTGRPHFPPPQALQRWANRHGISGPSAGFLVARAIARRGGLRPKRVFRDAVQKSLPAMTGYLARMGDEIERRWQRGG